MITIPRLASAPRLEPKPATRDRAWRARAIEFGREVVLPLGHLIDGLGPGAGCGPRPLIWEFLAQAREEGFTRLTSGADRDGVGLSRIGEFMVLEELATADAGLTALLIAAPVPFHWARDAPHRRLREISTHYLQGERLDWSGCWTASVRPSLHATRSNWGWVLSGRATSVLGAAIATHAALACSIEIGGSSRVALTIVELERPGITRLPDSGQLGLRAQFRAELELEGVFVSGEDLLFTAPAGHGSLTGAATLDQLIGAISAVGIARAAYQTALRFARDQPYAGATAQERRKADRLLPRLRSQLCHVRRSTAVVHLQRGLSSAPDEVGALEQAMIARLLATEVAVEIVRATSELCTRATNTRGDIEFLDGSVVRLEKLRRDARSLSDRHAGFAPAEPESVPSTLRRVEWTQSSSLASG